jgi:pimeloyl-ACP methyl ester carboxylesterase
VFFTVKVNEKTAQTKGALVLLHGFPTSSFDWKPLFSVNPSFSGLFSHVVTVDFVGFGLSTKPATAWSLVKQAGMVEALLASIGVGPLVHVVAHDYGVSVAQELLHRNRALSVAFLNGGLFPEAHRPVLMQKALRVPVLGQILSRLTSFSVFSRTFSEIHTVKPSRLDLEAAWALLVHNGGVEATPSLLGYIDERRLHGDRWSRAISESKVPIIFLCGADDPVSGRHMAELFIKKIPGAAVDIMEKTGHYPQTERPAEINAKLLQFFQTMSVS